MALIHGIAVSEGTDGQTKGWAGIMTLITICHCHRIVLRFDNPPSQTNTRACGTEELCNVALLTTWGNVV